MPVRANRGYHLISLLKQVAVTTLIVYIIILFSFHFYHLSKTSPLVKSTGSCIRTQCKRVILVGTAKNIAQYVPHTMEQLQKLGRLFGDYHIIISEYGSSDGTADRFRASSGMAKHGQVIQNKEPAVGDHYSRIAQARNAYLEIVQRRYNDWDYMVVFDLDFTCNLNLTTFREAVRLDSEWDAALSFSVGNYWDWTAFQPPYNKDLSKETFLSLLSTTPDDRFIQVGSAFATTAMYKIPKLVDVKYGLPYGVLIDHVILHMQLREKYGENAVLVSPLCFCQNDCMKK